MPRLGAGGGAALPPQQPRPGRRRGCRVVGRLRRSRAGRPRPAGARGDHRGARAARLGRDARDPVRQGGRRPPDAPGRAPCPHLDRDGRAGLVGRRLLPSPRGRRPDDVRTDDCGRLVLHWHAGHSRLHVRDVSRGCGVSFRRHSRGQASSHRRSRWDGRRPGLRRDAERRPRPCRRGRPVAGRASSPRRLGRRRRRLRRGARRAPRPGWARDGRARRQRRRRHPAASRRGGRLRRRHRPDTRARSPARVRPPRHDGRGGRRRNPGRSRFPRRGVRLADGSCQGAPRLQERGRNRLRVRERHQGAGRRPRGRGRLRDPGIRLRVRPVDLRAWSGPVSVDLPQRRSRRSEAQRGRRHGGRRHGLAPRLDRAGARARPASRPARAHLLAGARGARPRRLGAERPRPLGPVRPPCPRPRPHGPGVGRLADAGDRGDARRERRCRRLAGPLGPPQRCTGRELGGNRQRRWGRHRPLDPLRHGRRGRRNRAGRAEAQPGLLVRPRPRGRTLRRRRVSGGACRSSDSTRWKSRAQASRAPSRSARSPRKTRSRRSPSARAAAGS